MKKPILALAGGLVVALGACKDNPAAPSTDRVVAGSQQTLQSLVTGITAQDRWGAGSIRYYAIPGIMARDVIRPDAAEARYETDIYDTGIDPSDFLGESEWRNNYTAIRGVHSLLHDAALTSLPAAQRAAASGFVRTVEALGYLRIAELRDVNGVAIQMDDPAVVGPIKTKQSALAYVSALLDSALTDLQAGASAGTVPFTVAPGYQAHGDYAQVANLILFNRGLKGRAETYRALDAAAPNAASLPTALAALNAALANAPATPDQAYLNTGPYMDFNPAAPESFPNPLSDPKLMLTDNFVSSIMPGDARATTILPNGQSCVNSSANAAVQYCGSHHEAMTDASNAATTTAPLPILRNAELFLLRAQVEIAMGDLASATRDINVVHTVEGGLPPYPTFTTAAGAIQAVLYEFRYSFVFEGAQHLAALREYGMLNAAYVSQPGMPTPGPSLDVFTSAYPIPQTERNARNGNYTPVP